MPLHGKSTANGRFELPQFSPLNFSLTEGTDIPPPPASPTEEKPPPVAAPLPATPVDQEHTHHGTGNTATGNGRVNGGSGPYDGRGRASVTTTGTYSSTIEAPLSPASSKRPSSIRRFLSRKSLNANYTGDNGSDESLGGAYDRPESALSFASGRPAMKKQKSGSWFKRFGGGGGGNEQVNQRNSVIYEDMKTPATNSIHAANRPQKMGPPPPKLPELNRLKAKLPDDAGSLGGGEMFKNIN